MHRYTMLTENRKRRRSCDEEEPQLLPQAKRSGGFSFLPEVGRDVWDSEVSSSSDSSGISSPERMTAGSSSIQSSDQRRLHVSQVPCSPISLTHTEDPAISSSQNNVSYDHINRILREAHFSSVQTRGQQGPT